MAEHAAGQAAGEGAGEDRAPEILALRALKLGDLLVAVPAIRALGRANPEHTLVLAVPGWLAPIVELIGGVGELLPTPGLDNPLPLQAGRIDIAVNLHGNGPESRDLIDRLAAHRTISHSAYGGARSSRSSGSSDSSGPVWLDGILERARWARLVEAHGMPADENDLGLLVPQAAPAIMHATVIHVGAFYGSRRWPVERFAKVAAALHEQGANVVLTGSAAERPRALDVAATAGLPIDTVVAGRMELGEFAAVVAAADLLVSADTGAAHLASAYGIPSVVLFGPAPPEEWGPPVNGPHIVLTESALRQGDTFGDEPDPALLAVLSSDVLAAVRSLHGQRVTRPLDGTDRED